MAGTDAPDRAELESFVGAAFKRGHDATVTSFMPTLLSFRDRGGDCAAWSACGRPLPQPLYLEQYLEQPIETAIATATRRRRPA